GPAGPRPPASPGRTRADSSTRDPVGAARPGGPAVMYLLGVLVMVVGIAVSIALHEVGHLVPAKRFGVKVTQYMVGFGPTLWSRRRGETEYGVKAVPLGGYVRMIGMFPPRPGDGGRLRRSSSNPFHQMIEQARTDSLDEVEPGDED